jgi:serine-type D-Ala-D-Ala carboxypeptidase/endopeptidase
MEKALAEVSLTHAPGTQWEYSNFAFGMLAMAEEKVGNAPYETLVVNKIAGPLGLHDTRITLTAAEKARLAQGIGLNGDPVPPVATSGESLGAGAFRSTIQDLALYLAENIDPGTTKLASVLELTQQKQAIGANANFVAGLGWNISSPGTPRESISKDGSTDGYDAYIAFSRPSHTGFAVACDGHGLAKSLIPPLGKLIGEFDVPIDDAE